MEYVIIALIIAKFCEKGAIDITSMITGNQPPSKTFQAAKGTTAEAGPLGKFFKAWYADAIEDLDEKRRIKRMATKEEQGRARAERKADRQRILDAIDEKTKADEEEREEREPADDIPVEEPPDPRDSEAGEPLPVDDEEPWGGWPKEPWEEGPDQTIPDPLPWELPKEEPQATVEPDEPGQAQDPEEEIFDANLVEGGPGSAGATDPQGPQGPEIPKLKSVQAGGSDGKDEWSPYWAKPELYAVPDQEKEEGTMSNGTTVSTAVVAAEGGISTHIRWADNMIAYLGNCISHVEIVGASMYQGGNGPERLALIAEIQERNRHLALSYKVLRDTLIRDRNLIADAYAATNNQAGDRDYATET
jgi:hypothetical protein